MLDKIFNRKYLKVMKRLDLEIEWAIDSMNMYGEALHKREEELEKRGVKEADFKDDYWYSQVKYMYEYLNHEKTTLLSLRKAFRYYK